MSQTDFCMGRVLAELKALGLEQDTLVVAHSDHGARLVLSAPATWSCGRGGGY